MILVTGGTGFLGRHLIPALANQLDQQVRVLTRNPEKNSWLHQFPNVTAVQGDLRDAQAVANAVDGCRYVIHAAGLFRFWGDEKEFLLTNKAGTANLLAAACRVDVERFIYISTAALIGEPDPDGIVDESHPAHPADSYQRSKLEAEHEVFRYYQEHNLPTIVLRPGAFYGPLGEYAFNRLFFKDPMRGIIMQISGGKYIIFPAYIEDVVQGILLALEKARVGEIYNICGDWISHKEAFDIICEEAHIRWPRMPIPGWLGIFVSRVLTALSVFTRREPFWPLTLRSYVYNNWRVSSQKARRELGFQPTDFREGARRTIAWYKAGRPYGMFEVNRGD